MMQKKINGVHAGAQNERTGLFVALESERAADPDLGKAGVFRIRIPADTTQSARPGGSALNGRGGQRGIIGNFDVAIGEAQLDL